MYKILPQLQAYSWGSPEWIPRFLGVPNPEGKPWAELWYGAHPKAPSRVEGKELDLEQLIAQDPKRMLGEKVVERFGAQLPFLLKLLAAAEPLSIQCHPNGEQAREGYEREEQRGVPLQAPHRNYKDPHHKPEVLLALEPFTALCGFRSESSITQQLARLAGFLPTLTELQSAFARGGTRGFFTHLMKTSANHVGGWIEGLRGALARDQAAMTPEDQWFLFLSSRYPQDPGCFAPYYLNLVELSSGEALFLESGVLHAYMRGFGIELMANSDNVLRGGLTPKHVDVGELLRVVRFEPERPHVIRPEVRQFPFGAGVAREEKYPVPVAEFSLSRLQFEGMANAGLEIHGPEVLLCGEGSFEVKKNGGPCSIRQNADLGPSTGSSEKVSLRKGEACFVEAASDSLSLQGQGSVYRVRVGICESS